MAKRVIRLTESQFHALVKKCVNESLEEGQGWNYFKSAFKPHLGDNGKQNAFQYGMNNSDTLDDMMNDPDYQQQMGDFVEYGNAGPEDNKHWYGEDGMPTDFDGEHEKKSMGNAIDNSTFGKLGRKAGVAGYNAVAKAGALAGKAKKFFGGRK